ncbi:hypothetical protein AB1Y20_017806 [Prymnesium parvum]|uniref:Uncharacterized protein n=1 Tax=Prymnesium parvum TaxID=97485 RepID=A0AB34JNJ9_PRYPA
MDASDTPAPAAAVLTAGSVQVPIELSDDASDDSSLTAVPSTGPRSALEKGTKRPSPTSTLDLLRLA